MNAVNEGHPSCLLVAAESRLFQPQAEDILTDEDLLDLFRIVKQVLRKKPDSDKLAKLLFCVSYALGDHVKFFKPLHEDKILFRDDASGIANASVNAVRLPNNSSCCIITSSSSPNPAGDALDGASSTNNNNKDSLQKWQGGTATTSSPSLSSVTSTSQSPLTRLLAVPFLTNHASSTTSLSQPIQPLPLSLPLPQPQSPHHLPQSTPTTTATTNVSHSDVSITSDDTSTDPFSVRPYTNFRPLYPSSSSSPAIPTYSSFERSSNNSITDNHLQRYPLPLPSSSTTPPASNANGQHVSDTISSPTTTSTSSLTGLTTERQRTTSLPHSEVLMEPKQRGFYYQDGRIAREPVLLQRYAEQGILTQASLMRKRKRHSTDANVPYEMNQPPQPTKKPKIPHRHGEFEQRRDDIINRMRGITMQDLEQKAQRMPVDFALVIERSQSPETFQLPTPTVDELTKDQATELLEPSLRILTSHSNMKPHLDNGMNQNGIYYNSDYFRLYMAFEQFQKTFAFLYPNDVVKIPEDDLSGSNDGNSGDLTTSGGTTTTTSLTGMERDKDRERNANMKAYRNWIEPLLTETNWAAFRRNIVVGERMMQLTKVVGQGVLLMTKELSGSKLHLTFTNNEWDEFITGLSSGRWDQTIKWETTATTAVLGSRLVHELRQKFITKYWFHPNGSMVTSKDRKLLYRSMSLSSSSSSSSSSSTQLHNNNTSNNNNNSHASSSTPSPSLSSMAPTLSKTPSSSNHPLQHHHHPHHHQQHPMTKPDSNNNNPNATIATTTDAELPFHKVDMTLFGDMIR
ncbi:hypothetical protein BCR42DRAFT_418875 [Absidia repens]|uniref:Uncharacterized protein n=1 Tax=Absidia repens TaxID=90262 RepID=A0A1X2IC65_9FUNG|nr:hypothetical protein BCR42DRAFT_418875 [Absidia repens]